jgi:hypothetical protein
MIPYVLLSWHLSLILSLKISDWITFSLVCLNSKFQKKSSQAVLTEINQVELCKRILQELACKATAGTQMEKDLNTKEINFFCQQIRLKTK